MIELRRKQLKPIQTGDFIKMKGSVRSAIIATDEYQQNGNVDNNAWNPDMKIHFADVDVFYCSHDSAMNSNDLLEVIPVTFIDDHPYRDVSGKVALRNRMKLMMSRKNFFVIQNPENEIEYFDYIRNNKLVKISKRFKIKIKWANR